MSKTKIKIAITGSIGSGKSAFSEFIRENGYCVLNADEISKEILAVNQEVKEKVIREFGPDSFNGREINKKYLSEKVFTNPENVFKMNSILHPLVIERVNDLMRRELQKNDKVFTEAALIYEAEMEDLFDYVVLITAGKEIRYKRKASVMPLEDFEKRDFNQIPDEEKKKRADFIFENNGSLDELKQKTNLLLSLI